MSNPQLKPIQKMWSAPPDYDQNAVERLCRELPSLHPIIARLMVLRGMAGKAETVGFFRPGLDILDQSGTLKDLEKGTKRLIRAIDNREKILLYGDYDVDGTCSVSMMLLFLRSLGATVSYYIPDRYAEGYGVSDKGVGHALEEEVALMITLDCGITAVEKLGHLTDAGVDVIVCDHHLPGAKTPEVYAVLNPQQPDCAYAGKELCGCGVGFMLLRETARHYGLPSDRLRPYLALTTVATCSDIVPMRNVNRAIVAEGMKVLNDKPPTGIAALLGAARFQGELNVSEVVFKIGPRINAAGRLEHANRAVEILTTEDPARATEYAAHIEKVNGERRSLDRQTAEEALIAMREADPGLKAKSTVVFDPNWHKGIVGIVASRLMETCYRPTVVFTQSGELLTGSGRSVEGFHLHKALQSCSHLIEKFGGHAAAAGLSIKPENLNAFKEAFEEAALSELGHTGNHPPLSIDLEVALSEWYDEEYAAFYKQIHAMRPFGPGNRAPIFSMSQCRAERVKIVGNGHLKFTVFQEHKNRGLPVIGFGLGGHFSHLNEGLPFDLAYVIEENVYRGNRSIQLNAKDIRPA